MIPSTYAAVLSLLAVSLGMSPPLQQPPASAPIAKLAGFLGKWNAAGEMNDTPYSKAHPARSATNCDWSANHGFMICDQLIESSDGLRNDLSIYTYNEKSHEFAFFGLSRNDPEPRATKLTIDGDLWTYSSDDMDGSKRIHFRTTNQFVSPDTVVWRSEYSEDGTHWVLMGQGKDTRTK